MKLGPYDLDTIYTGDARLLAPAIPDESIDLIFTDPVYQNLDDYRWLAETAARVLKPDRTILTFCQERKAPKIISIMEEQGLCWHWRCNYILFGRPNRLYQYKVFNKCFPLLWFGKGQPAANTWFVDTIVLSNSENALPDANQHEWTKHPEAIAHFLLPFTTQGSIVLDPFCGGGTVPAVCKMLGRRYLAFEIDPAVAERARLRVEQTQPPLFIPEPEQLTLDVGLMAAHPIPAHLPAPD